MTLAAIVILLGIALWLIKSIVTPGQPRAPDEALGPFPQHSDYKQLRIEDHRSIDKSLQPPRH